MLTFDMCCLWDKDILIRKNTETVENWLLKLINNS